MKPIVITGWLSALLVLVGVASASPRRAGATVGHCSAAELVVARGTGEPGPLGVIVGDPLYKDLRALKPGLTSYRVNYPASLSKLSPRQAIVISSRTFATTRRGARTSSSASWATPRERTSSKRRSARTRREPSWAGRP